MRLIDEVGYFLPLDLDVEIDPEPAAVTHIRRSEETSWLGRDQLLLEARGSRAPEAQAVIMVVIGIGHKHLLVIDKPGGLAMTRSLGCPWQGKANSAQFVKRVLDHLPDFDQFAGRQIEREFLTGPRVGNPTGQGSPFLANNPPGIVLGIVERLTRSAGEDDRVFHIGRCSQDTLFRRGAKVGFSIYELNSFVHPIRVLCASQFSVGSLEIACVLERVQELVAIPSTTGNETAAIECVHGWLLDMGADELDRWDVDIDVLAEDPDYPGREVERDVVPVVAAMLVGERPGPTVTLTGHVDTVPSGDRWSSDPFTPRIEADRVYGLGACDMKGGVVAAVEAFAAIARSGRDFAGEVQIVLVPGEEDGGTGTLAAIRRGWGGGMVVVTEPTSRTGSPEIVVAHGGALTFTIGVTGRSAHASIAPEGENALSHFWEIHQALFAIEQQINSQEQNPLMVALGTPYATNVGKISGGVWSASVMENLRAEVRMGVALHETIEEAEQRVIEGVRSATANNKWFAEHPPTIVRTGGAFGSAETPADHHLVRTLADTAESLTGRRPQRIGVPYGCDMALWQRVGKTAPIVYGPGDIRQAHAPDEWVSIQQVEEVAAVLEQTCYALLKPSMGSD